MSACGRSSNSATRSTGSHWSPSPRPTSRSTRTTSALLIAGVTAKTLILNGQRDETAAAARRTGTGSHLTAARVEMVPGDAALSLSAVWGRALSHVAPRTQALSPDQARA